ncbi:formate dehydrogenase accessory sulfurtransferase FdhD [Formicincola oecophyllae]|uniref:Sulfur carrier protein FdhD n=1 Tax=Formicincola oecophyllae TaxID=2558361 RepID=A0A4Y6U7X2_9PROT|nr:formate dehydrogenase accessory sulfurtransferase FdhD [Formicincola oecophyllae]QDH13442.1 formate dehydrogenase accessory sulfurtransferase FdhD [Formicincola oecophyllae]
MAEEKERAIAGEVPISIVYNGVHPYAVMMATPADLADYAVGFTCAEGIAQDEHDIVGCSWQVESPPTQREAQGVRLDVQLAPEAFSRLLQRQQGRALVGGSACGVCGQEDSSFMTCPVERSVLPPTQRPSPNALLKAVEGLREHQPFNKRLRMLHAAAWADPAGNILLAREDIGRHNALDKLVGALRRSGYDRGQGFVVLSSRCSFEMAQKAVLAGMRVLVAVSAPSRQAVALARQGGLALASCQRGVLDVFTHPGYLALPNERAQVPGLR